MDAEAWARLRKRHSITLIFFLRRSSRGDEIDLHLAEFQRSPRPSFGSVTGSLPRSGLLIVSRVIGNR
jgi:hypothetical protein